MSVALPELWLPILVSSVVVFFASFLAHMILPHHKKDYRKVADEDTLLDWVRSTKPAPGQYMFPGCEDWSELKDPEVKKRWEAGPHGTMNVYPGPPSMGRNLILTFVYYIVVSVFIAYLARLSLGADAGFMEAFRFTGTAGVMAYVLGWVGNSIWFNQPRKAFINDLCDGIVYGLLTGVVFGLLWPSAESALEALPSVGG